jgi:SpoVK/Ycf46/Vps4 family AAA+-type ATPase
LGVKDILKLCDIDSAFKSNFNSLVPGSIKSKYINFFSEITQSSECIMDVNIYSNVLEKEQIRKIFLSFLNYINTFIENKEIKEPVKSFIIKIETEKKVSMIQNPEYYIYEKRKAELEKIFEIDKETNVSQRENSIVVPKGSKKNSRKNESMTSFFNLVANSPPETIEKIDVESNIKIIEVNEIYKSFDNLYLRENDKKKLKNILEMFYDNKELMNDYGIPHKLGIMLYGVPGTGKSSTIQVIATWLKKNIYCVDFKTVKTNKDFYQIVEHICKHCNNGGILVLEDFDSMGTVMHKRTSQTNIEENLVNLLEQTESELTLDYILNILQGSLTPSGFVFIATTNHIEKIDEAIYRDGRIDLKINMKKCDYYQMQSIYKKFIKREIPESILCKIQEDKWTPANFIFKLIHYIKLDDTDENILKDFIE